MFVDGLRADLARPGFVILCACFGVVESLLYLGVHSPHTSDTFPD